MATDTDTPDTATSTPTSGGPAVVIDRVSKTYSVRSLRQETEQQTLWNRLRGASGVETVQVPALHQISLVVEHGESVGVIGTNGSGKSTLMKLLTGQLQPTEGNVYATSTPIMLGVNAALVQEITGEDNIMLGCLAMGMSRAEAATKRDLIVELSGLEDSLHLPLKTYSSGMAARLQFAIATSMDPEILIIDEALNTGDANFRERTGQRVAELREQAGAVFIVSHTLGVIRDMCTRAIWIERGELLMDGDPETVTAQYQSYANALGRNRVKAPRLIREDALRSLQPVEVVWEGGREPTSGRHAS